MYADKASNCRSVTSITKMCTVWHTCTTVTLFRTDEGSQVESSAGNLRVSQRPRGIGIYSILRLTRNNGTKLWDLYQTLAYHFESFCIDHSVYSVSLQFMFVCNVHYIWPYDSFLFITTFNECSVIHVGWLSLDTDLLFSSSHPIQTRWPICFYVYYYYLLLVYLCLNKCINKWNN